MSAASQGTLVLVPNTLDLGTGSEVPLDEVLPRAVIARAAGLGHWVAENAKSARALLKRIDAVVPLAQPLQAIQITELPRPRKGGGPSVSAPDFKPLLAPALAGHDLSWSAKLGCRPSPTPALRWSPPPTTLA